MKKNTITTLVAVILITTFISAFASDTSLARSRNGLYIAEFNGELSDEQESLLLVRGIRILEYAGANKYWLKAGPYADLSDLEFVKSVKRAGNTDKVSRSLASVASLSSNESRLVATVSFFKGTSYREARALITSLGGKALQSEMLYGNRLHVDLPAAAIASLAENDAVLALEGPPRMKMAVNSIAAEATTVTNTRIDFGLSGDGVVGGIWDEGWIGEHPDLDGRTIAGEKSKVSDHATHVAGTIIGNGTHLAAAAGMAPTAKLVSYNFNGDVATEMAEAVRQHGIAFSNNSWTYANGWGYHSILKLWLWWGDGNFGRYNSESAAYDELVYKTDLIVLFAAGNDRTDVGTSEEKYLDLTIGRGNDAPHPADGPYCTVDVTGSAKNVITVGAVDKNGKMTTFSSWGPTQDGRLKPEVCSVGYHVTSTMPGGQYATWSGTSMATPAASGAVALLVEEYRTRLGRNPSAAEIRALIAVTARDLGQPGPDYRHGFGMLDAHSAAALIADNDQNSQIITDRVRKAKAQRTKCYQIQVPAGSRDLKVALAWIDPPASPNAKHTLVNDLDLRLYRNGSDEVEMPYILDPAKPNASAKKGDNTVDNIELVEVMRPKAGVWTIEISADTFGKGNKQKFALVVTSNKGFTTPVTEVDPD